jgi:hypothetical protein
MANKKFKTYSITGIFTLIILFTFLSISWKTDRTDYNLTSDSTSNSIDTAKITAKVSFDNYLNDTYTAAKLSESNLSLAVFTKALTGFLNLKNKHSLNQHKEILTVVDFTKPSTAKRMWIIDLKNNELLLNTYVAHGQGSGADLANVFSNKEESHQSSLGFYVTNETYIGKHGLSLKLDGQDKGSNDLARERAIVVHGASYVSESFINETGRLGRSFGCPAVSEQLNSKIIAMIKDKTCFFINGNSNTYQSSLLDNSNLEQNFSNMAAL